MMAFCVMRLGRHVSKVPHAVVAGFSVGIGGIMVISQMNVILGVAAPKGSSALLQWRSARADRTRSYRALCVERDRDRSGVRVRAFRAANSRAAGRRNAGWPGGGGAQVSRSRSGSLKLELPDFAGFAWSPQDVMQVIPSGLALAFVTSVNLLMTSRVVEHFRGRHQHMKRTDADSELGAYGIANLCAGIFGAPMSVGIPARSLAAVRCGGTTQHVQPATRRVPVFPGQVGVGLPGAHSAGGFGRRDGVDGFLPARLERLAETDQDAPNRCQLRFWRRRWRC